MLTHRLLRYYGTTINRRLFSQTSKSFESKPSDSASKASSSTNDTSSSSAHMTGASMYAPSNFDKWVLAWVKKYPKGQVPEKIRPEEMVNARDRARVKTANYMMVFAVIGCIISVMIGKNAVSKGESIQKRQDEWRARVKKDYEASLQKES